MKTLAKILCLLAIALFISSSVKADNDPNWNLTPAGNAEESGHVGCNVPQHLAICCTPATVHFEYNFFGTPDDLVDNNSAIVKANIPWTFTITPAASALTTPAGDAMSTDYVGVAFDGGARQVLSTSPSVEGDYIKTINMAWDLLIPGTGVNFRAGIYQVDITYTASPNLE